MGSLLDALEHRFPMACPCVRCDGLATTLRYKCQFFGVPCTEDNMSRYKNSGSRSLTPDIIATAIRVAVVADHLPMVKCLVLHAWSGISPYPRQKKVLEELRALADSEGRSDISRFFIWYEQTLL